MSGHWRHELLLVPASFHARILVVAVITHYSYCHGNHQLTSQNKKPFAKNGQVGKGRWLTAIDLTRLRKRLSDSNCRPFPFGLRCWASPQRPDSIIAISRYLSIRSYRRGRIYRVGRSSGRSSSTLVGRPSISAKTGRAEIRLISSNIHSTSTIAHLKKSGRLQSLPVDTPLFPINALTLVRELAWAR
jgi:hypothetical protein